MQTARDTRLQAWGITLLRVVTGTLFLGTGVQNLLLQAEGSQLPGPVVAAGSLLEVLCGAALVIGLLARLASIPLVLLMLADIVVIHPPGGFFVGDEGFEHALLRLAASAALVIAGSGRLALDEAVSIRRKSK